MEKVMQYLADNALALIAIVIAIISLIVAIRSGKQNERMFQHLDEKRKCYSNYDAAMDFQQEVDKLRKG